MGNVQFKYSGKIKETSALSTQTVKVGKHSTQSLGEIKLLKDRKTGARIISKAKVDHNKLELNSTLGFLGTSSGPRFKLVELKETSRDQKGP